MGPPLWYFSIRVELPGDAAAVGRRPALRQASGALRLVESAAQGLHEAARKGLSAVQDGTNPSHKEHSQETLLRERRPSSAHLFRGEPQAGGCTGKRDFG